MPGEEMDCDDDNVCTMDRCEEGGCVNEPDPGMDGQSCDDGSMCSSMVCDNGQCVEDPDATETDGTMCDDENECTENDQCLDGECVGEEIDTGSWFDDSSLTGDVQVPPTIKSKIESVINAIPGLGSISLEEARVGLRGRARNCCDEESGLQELGVKEASATGLLKVKINSWTLWGPPAFDRTYDFGIAVLEIVFDVGVKANLDFRASGEIGRHFNACDPDDTCTFGNLRGSVDLQPEIKIEVIGCFETAITDEVCAGLDVKPAAIRFSVTAGGSFNLPACGSGFDFFGRIGRITFRAEFISLFPGRKRIVFEHVIFGGATLF